MGAAVNWTSLCDDTDDDDDDDSARNEESSSSSWCAQSLPLLTPLPSLPLPAAAAAATFAAFAVADCGLKGCIAL